MGMLLRRYHEKNDPKEEKQEVKQLKDYKVAELKEMCKEMNLEKFDNLKKDELIKLIEDSQVASE